MVKRRVYDSERHAHFVTFSCYRRRTLLQHDQAKRIVIGHLGARLTKRNGLCIGFVIMPDHVHTLVWFPEVGQLSRFMNEWKSQSSAAIRKLYESQFPQYWSQVERTAVWQPRYYGFNVFSREKLEEKLTYMHLNPVRAGFVEKAVEWPYSSARWYEQHKSVGLPIRWPPGME
ncbi:MAG: transposase [Planctomycetaceae bacterium]|nr:transposase [Planctomycetaceae bacterium]